MLVYYLGKQAGKDKKVKYPYVLSTIVVAIFTFYYAYSIGTHTSNEELDDSLYGVPNVEIDFEPTSNQKMQRFIYMFSLFIIPMFLGTYNGVRQKRKEREFYKSNMDES